MKTKINKNPMIILCGGKGKRMGEITKKIPKPLLKIGKKTIIEHKIKYFLSPTYVERWPSGRRRTLGKRVYGQPYQGFESLSLRHYQLFLNLHL